MELSPDLAFGCRCREHPPDSATHIGNQMEFNQLHSRVHVGLCTLNDWLAYAFYWGPIPQRCRPH